MMGRPRAPRTRLSPQFRHAITAGPYERQELAIVGGWPLTGAGTLGPMFNGEPFPLTEKTRLRLERLAARVGVQPEEMFS